jgi:hypothetical protein
LIAKINDAAKKSPADGSGKTTIDRLLEELEFHRLGRNPPEFLPGLGHEHDTRSARLWSKIERRKIADREPIFFCKKVIDTSIVAKPLILWGNAADGRVRNGSWAVFCQR